MLGIFNRVKMVRRIDKWIAKDQENIRKAKKLKKKLMELMTPIEKIECKIK